MVVAKHAYAHERLAAQMKSGVFIRHYLALVRGAFSEPRGSVDAPLGHPPAATIKREVMADGKPAVTHYRVLCSGDSLSLLRLWLDTGRTHQIRAHMAYLGHPLYGDFLYGTEEAAMNRPALHSCYAAFQHPVTGQKKAFCCAPPADFRAVALACFQKDIMEERKGEKPQ